MTGFLCKQVEPYNYILNIGPGETNAAGEAGNLEVDNATATSIANMSISVIDNSGVNRANWIDGFFTSTLTGRDLLTLTYKNYTEKAFTTITSGGTVTSAAHGYTTGDTVRIDGTSQTAVDDKDFVITVNTASTFTLSSVTVAAGAGTVFAYGDFVDEEVLFEITAATASSQVGYVDVGVKYVSGDLPTVSVKSTLAFNKAGLVASKLWYGDCTRVQESLGLCSSTSGAIVPAVTVCKEEL